MFQHIGKERHDNSTPFLATLKRNRVNP